MAIKIIPEEDIFLTQSEYNKFMQEYENFCSGAVNPPSFEEFVKRQKNVNTLVSVLEATY